MGSNRPRSSRMEIFSNQRRCVSPYGLRRKAMETISLPDEIGCWFRLEFHLVINSYFGFQVLKIYVSPNSDCFTVVAFAYVAGVASVGFTGRASKLPDFDSQCVLN